MLGYDFTDFTERLRGGIDGLSNNLEDVSGFASTAGISRWQVNIKSAVLPTRLEGAAKVQIRSLFSDASGTAATNYQDCVAGLEPKWIKHSGPLGRAGRRSIATALAQSLVF